MTLAVSNTAINISANTTSEQRSFDWQTVTKNWQKTLNCRIINHVIWFKSSENKNQKIYQKHCQITIGWVRSNFYKTKLCFLTWIMSLMMTFALVTQSKTSCFLWWKLNHSLWREYTLNSLNPLCFKDVYISPPCTLPTYTVHAFRAYQRRIYTSLAVGKKSLSMQRVNAA